MKRKLIIVSVFFIVLLSFVNDVEAQCAMCKMAQKSSGWSNRGLNNGILYLMSIPYIAFGFIAYFWYKSSRKNKEQQKKIDETLKSNI